MSDGRHTVEEPALVDVDENETGPGEEAVYQYAAFGRFLLSLRKHAKTGRDLIGLGEAIDFCEQVAEGEPAELDAVLTITAVMRNENGTHSASIDMNEDEIEFSVTESSYDEGVGSDRETRTYGSFDARYGLEFTTLDEWISVFFSVLSDGSLSVERHHA